MATLTASAMLEEIAAYETYSETLLANDAETIVQTFKPFGIVVMKTTIQVYFASYLNDKSNGYFNLSLKPRPRVWKSLLASGFLVGSRVPLVELKDQLLPLTRIEKLKALVG